MEGDMKKFLIVIFTMSCLFLSINTSAIAENFTSNGNCANQFCKNWQEKDPEKFYESWKNFGQCVSFFRSGVVQFCELFVDMGWIENVDECVSYLRPNVIDCRVQK
jgi:hypothetical protein